VSGGAKRDRTADLLNAIQDTMAHDTKQYKTSKMEKSIANQLDMM
jgi:hypothetical protein